MTRENKCVWTRTWTEGCERYCNPQKKIKREREREEEKKEIETDRVRERGSEAARRRVGERVVMTHDQQTLHSPRRTEPPCTTQAVVLSTYEFSDSMHKLRNAAKLVARENFDESDFLNEFWWEDCLVDVVCNSVFTIQNLISLDNRFLSGP